MDTTIGILFNSWFILTKTDLNHLINICFQQQNKFIAIANLRSTLKKQCINGSLENITNKTFPIFFSRSVYLPTMSSTKAKKLSSDYSNTLFVYILIQYTFGPHTKDIDKTDKVQRRALKMIPEIRNHSDNHRFKHLKLISLVQWRLREQLIDEF